MIINGIAILQNMRLPIIIGKTTKMAYAVRDANGDDIDISSGYTARIRAVRQIGDSVDIFDGDDNDVLTLGVGHILLTLDAADTAGFTAGAGMFAIELSDGTVITDVVSGTLTIEQSAVLPVPPEPEP
jgi:hypothetical protein